MTVDWSLSSYSLQTNKQNKNLRCGNRKGLLGRNDQTHTKYKGYNMRANTWRAARLRCDSLYRELQDSSVFCHSVICVLRMWRDCMECCPASGSFSPVSRVVFNPGVEFCYFTLGFERSCSMARPV